MGKKIRKYRNFVEQVLSGEKGQRFFNAAYSIGAAVVIWGALFKILHLPGGNTLLCIGMGTEVIMFILTAFDRPEEQYHWEEVFPVLRSGDPDDRPDFAGGAGGGVVINGGVEGMDPEALAALKAHGGVAGGAPTVVGGGIITGSQAVAAGVPLSDEDSAKLNTATEEYMSQLNLISDQLRELRATTESLNQVSESLLASYRTITDNSANLSESASGYAAQMQQLNGNLTELNRLYVAQMQGIGVQVESMNRMVQGFSTMSAEPERMAANMRQLNGVYERILNAMTLNMGMYGPQMPPAYQPPFNPGTFAQAPAPAQPTQFQNPGNNQ